MDYMLDPPDDDEYYLGEEEPEFAGDDESCYDPYDDEASANASSNWQNSRGF
ncbi:hypothetical protein PJKIFABJ_00181 [Pseudomonas phage PE09]|uniref:Uncharacterized protein n=1 Tax=Pseudomonas phage PE09 TaxID=2696355 RepID=A0A9E6KUQ4_9CAUD|nr:hypothetical protein QGX22_gp073 [Pseudomonas phage PE09]QHZ60117.1 hypothetical protein PJKIFABJ_00181 [Pseudomonas phage PE09]